MSTEKYPLFRAAVATPAHLSQLVEFSRFPSHFADTPSAVQAARGLWQRHSSSEAVHWAQE